MEGQGYMDPKDLAMQEGMNGDRVPEIFQAANEKSRVYQDIQEKYQLRDADMLILSDSENPYRLREFNQEQILRLKEIKDKMSISINEDVVKAETDTEPVVGSPEEGDDTPVVEPIDSPSLAEKLSRSKNSEREPVPVNSDTTERFKRMSEGMDKTRQYELSIKDAFDMRSLYQAILTNGDLTAKDGYVYKAQDLVKIISSLTGSEDPNLNRVTSTFNLRNKVKLLLLQFELSQK